MLLGILKRRSGRSRSYEEALEHPQTLLEHVQGCFSCPLGGLKNVRGCSTWNVRARVSSHSHLPPLVAQQQGTQGFCNKGDFCCRISFLGPFKQLCRGNEGNKQHMNGLENIFCPPRGHTCVLSASPNLPLGSLRDGHPVGSEVPWRCQRLVLPWVALFVFCDIFSDMCSGLGNFHKEIPANWKRSEWEIIFVLASQCSPMESKKNGTPQ